MPFFIKKPTPLLPLIAPLKFSPTHSYPLICNSSFPFKCVSIIATTSGLASCMNCIILYFLQLSHLHWCARFSWYLNSVLLSVVLLFLSTLLMLFNAFLFFPLLLLFLYYVHFLICVLPLLLLISLLFQYVI